MALIWFNLTLVGWIYNLFILRHSLTLFLIDVLISCSVKMNCFAFYQNVFTSAEDYLFWWYKNIDAVDKQQEKTI